MARRIRQPLADALPETGIRWRSARIPPSYAARIIEIGTALYGSTWQTELSRALQPHHPQAMDIGSVTVRKWAAGTRRPPQWVWDALPVIFRERIEQQERVLKRLAEEPPFLAAC